MNKNSKEKFQIELGNKTTRFEAWVAEKTAELLTHDRSKRLAAELEISHTPKVVFRISQDFNFDGKVWRAWVQIGQVDVPPIHSNMPYVAGSDYLEALNNLFEHWTWKDVKVKNGTEKF